jgi:glycosyltransferase involved in cell wall biosynthesis
MNNDHLVSVLVLTYNHADYIGKALDSILAQQTDFPFEIVLGDDCSTDHTRSVIEGYMERNPGRINAKFHPQNLGNSGRYNFIDTFNRCTGKYIAMLEGDDYWDDPQKLHKQVTFLEAHPDYSMSCSNVAIWYEKEKAFDRTHSWTKRWKSTIDINDIIEGHQVYIPSLVFIRKYLDVELMKQYTMFGDTVIIYQLIQRGKIRCFQEFMAVYRIHSRGVTQQLFSKNPELLYKESIQLLDYLDNATGFKNKAAIAKRKKRHQANLAILKNSNSPANIIRVAWHFVFCSKPKNLRELKNLLVAGFPKMHARFIGRS